jgi:hypothetical protein
MTIYGPGLLSRYSKWLRAGRSGDRIAVEAKFSLPFQTGPGANSTSCAKGTVSYPGVKRPGCDIDHSSQSSAEVKEKSRAIHLLPIFVLMSGYRVTFTFFNYLTVPRQRFISYGCSISAEITSKPSSFRLI